MRTAQQCRNELNYLRKEHLKLRYENTHKAKLIKDKIDKLVALLAYIESEPSEAYLWRQINKINKILQTVDDSIREKRKHSRKGKDKVKEEIKMLRAELSVTKLKAQLQNLEYILGVQ